MSIHVITLCISLGNIFFKSIGPRYFTTSLVRQICSLFFFNLDFICLRVPELITTNNHFSYETNSTWWKLKSTKPYWGISGNQWLYIIYTLQRVIAFRGRKVNSYFEGKTHQIQLINTPKLIFFLNHQPPNEL